jgi:hypothetical protein
VRLTRDRLAYRRLVHPSGPAALVVVGLWLVYLVPHRLRHRQQLLESRTDDRFSGELRVLAIAAGGSRRDAAATSRERAAGEPWCSALLTPTRGTEVRMLGGGVGVMNRPQDLQDRAEARALRRDADVRAHRAAAVGRRSASARRRAVLTLALVTAGIAGWLVVGIGDIAIGWALGPSVALLAVLGLGRRAVVLNARSDAAWALRTSAAPVRTPQRSVTGRATLPSDLETAAVRRVRVESRADDADVTSAAEHADAASAAGWAPVPVPRPTYTLKPAARRREPAPLPVEMISVDVTVPAREEPVAAPETTGGLDLDAILARRRASGE